MSKNIVIQEGGIGKQITADKLKTNLVGGSSCLWVPEDETLLGTKNITENGTYRASDDGYYGYSEVTVNGVGSVSGKDPATGEDVVVGTDPTTGEITQTVVPHSIRVVTPPYNPYGTYTDGQAIDISAQSGFEVVALLANGDLYNAEGYNQGRIPNSELSINPTNADYSQTSGNRSTEYAGFGQGPWPQPINSCIGEIRDGEPNNYKSIECNGGYCALLLRENGYRDNCVMCSSSQGTWKTVRQGGTQNPMVDTGQLERSFTHDGKTVYYHGNVAGLYWAEGAGSNSVVSGDGLDLEKAAWAIVYGTQTQAPNSQTITVYWPRPLDGKVLETTFEILVAPGYTPGGDE